MKEREKETKKRNETRKRDRNQNAKKRIVCVSKISQVEAKKRGAEITKEK